MFSVVQPHFTAYRRIVRYFGTEILLENGEINREALGNIIFSHPEKRQLLNSITHPEIQKEMLKQVLKYFVLGTRPGSSGAPAQRGSGSAAASPLALPLLLNVGRETGREQGNRR